MKPIHRSYRLLFYCLLLGLVAQLFSHALTSSADGAAPYGLGLDGEAVPIPRVSTSSIQAQTMPMLHLDVVANPPAVRPGELANLEVTIRNGDAVPLGNVRLGVTLPSDLAMTTALPAAIGTIAAGGQISVKLEWSMKETATGPQLMTLQATADGFSEPVTRQVAIEYAGPLNTNRNINRSGGSILSGDGRITVNFPAGAFNQTTNVTLSLSSVPTETLLLHHKYFFTLSSPSIGARQGLVGPVEIKLDPVGHLNIPPGAISELALFRYDSDSGQWQRLPGRVDLETGLLIVTTEQLGLFGLASVTSGNWTDYENPAPPTMPAFQVSLFTGNVSFDYPLELPAGRGGQTPALSLSYNSGLVDGMTDESNNQTSWVGLGWELGNGYISRKLVRDDSQVPENIHEYSLVFNGVSSKLICIDGGDPANCVNYRTEDETFWRIQRLPTSPASGTDNQEEIYWLLTNKEGVQYRFGGQDESYGVDSRNSAWWMIGTEQGSGTPALDELKALVWRWNLDQVEDTYHNIIRYDYQVERNFFGWCSPGQWPFPWDPDISECRFAIPSGQGAKFLGINYSSFQLAPYRLWDGYIRGGYLSQISYSWPNPNNGAAAHQILFQRVDRLGSEYDGSLDSQDGGQNTVIPFEPFFTKQRLASIQILTAGQQVRRYELLGTLGASNKWTVTQIKVHGSLDSDTLPPLVLTYYPYANYRSGAGEEFYLDRLDTVHNSYGAMENLVYIGNPTGQYEKENTDGATDHHWLGYRVRCRFSGLAANYTPTGCNNPTNWHIPGYFVYRYYDDNPQNRVWVAPDDPDSPTKEFRGHGQVSVYDPAGLMTTYLFLQGNGDTIFQWDPLDSNSPGLYDGDGLEGRPYQITTTSTDGNTLYSRTLTHYAVEQLGLRRFSYADETRSYTWDGDTDFRRTATTYTYNPAVQGGTQYGNLTRIIEVGEMDVVGDERTTHYLYYPNTTNWIVGQPARQSLYIGVHVNDDHGSDLRARQRFYYGASWDQPPGSHGLLTQTDAWLGGSNYAVSQMAYDSTYGNLLTTTDPDNHTTTYDYDSTYEIYPWTITNHKGHTVNYRYDSLWRKNQEWGPNGNAADPSTKTQYQYSSFGRLIRLALPGNTLAQPTVSYTYHDENQASVSYQQVDVRALPDSLQMETRYFYDGLGRAIQTQVQQAELLNGTRDIVSYVLYDARGQVQKESVSYSVLDTGSGLVTPDLNQPVTQYSYRLDGQLQTVTGVDGETTSYSYDQWRTTVIDPLSHKVVQETNAFGQLARVEEYTGTNPYALYATTTYSYDTQGNLLQVTDDFGNITAMTYDPLGRKIEMNDPDMGHWYYQYDPAGNLIVQIDAKLQAINLYYDELNRLKGKTYNSGPVNPVTYLRPADPGYNGYAASYTYDSTTGGNKGIGLQTGMSDLASGSSLSWLYDIRGRLTQATRQYTSGGSFTFGYTYDELDRLATTTYPDGEVLTTYYNNQGLPEQLALAESGNPVVLLVEDAKYNARGQQESLDRGNDTATDYQYYDQIEAFRMMALETSGSGSSLLQDLQYTYDDVGNVTSISDSLAGEVQSYTYDALNRLKTAEVSDVGSLPAYDLTYTINEIGNITGVNDDGTATTYNYLPAQYSHSQPHAVKSLSGGSTGSFTYDPNGNMTGRNDDTGSYTQIFDAENRLTQVDKAGGGTTSFTYDASGQRVRTVEPNGNTLYYPFPNYEKEIRPDIWSDVTINSSGPATNDPPGWNVNIPSQPTWTASQTFPGTSLSNGTDHQLSNLATGTSTSAAIAVQANHNYQLTAYVKGELNGNAANGTAQIRILGTTGIGGPPVIWSASSLNNAASWQQVQGNFTIGGANQNIQVEISLSGMNGWLAVDNVTLLDVTSHLNVPVPNGSFESGSWTNAADPAYPATSFWRSSLEGPGVPAQQGSYSLVVSNLAYTNVASPFINISGVSQVLKVWLRGEVDGAFSGGSVNVTLEYYNNGIATGVPASWSVSTYNNTTWQQITVNGTRPGGANQVKIRLSSNYTNGWMAFDQVTLTETGGGLPPSVPDSSFETGGVWFTTNHANFPASTAWRGQLTGYAGQYAMTLTNGGYGSLTTNYITVTPSMSYTVAALLRGEHNTLAGINQGRIRVEFYDSNNISKGSAVIWEGSDLTNNSWTSKSGSFLTASDVTKIKVVLQTQQANGWLAVDDVTLTSHSAMVSSGPSQVYSLSTWVAGVMAAPVGQNGGRILVNYYNSSGSQIGSNTLWTANSYNQSGGQTQSNTFTTPAGTVTFRVALETHLDNGWLVYDTMTLTGRSQTITASAGQFYRLNLVVGGQVQASLGQGGRILAVFNSGSPSVLWESPVNFNNAGLSLSNTFTVPGGAANFYIAYEVRLDNGRLAFSNITLERRDQAAATITRSTYSLAGQTIATRVSGDSNSNNNGLFFIYTDHLGSTSLLTNSGGTPIAGSQAHYMPFGDFRTIPTAELTDRGYTGQLHNNLPSNDLGLIYMNARYYVPGIGRFASADTIVPAPTNPQSFNRYSYSFNNPLNYTDPNGHCPAPTAENGYEGNGNVICVAGFIPTAESQSIGLIFEGDDRWFSAQSDPNNSRFWVWIDVDTGEIVGSFIHPTTALNDNGFWAFVGDLIGDRDCNGSVCTYEQPAWTFNISAALFENGNIMFNYSILCSHPTCYGGPGPDGTIVFTPDGHGSFNAWGVTEAFPNLEGYHWENGEVRKTLFQINNFSQSELDNDRLEFSSAVNMYGGAPFGSSPSYWEAYPWWYRGSLGH
jgi:RHS repeat-associated protein